MTGTINHDSIKPKPQKHNHKTKKDKHWVAGINGYRIHNGRQEWSVQWGEFPGKDTWYMYIYI